MADHGNPASYLTLQPGTAVFGSDEREMGTVEHVLSVPEDDIFDGLVVHAGGRRRFADASLVAEICERGVVLNVPADASLPEPSENPAAMSADPDDTTPDGLSDKLKRAWDLISGNY
jgi:hypothetical protein